MKVLNENVSSQIMNALKESASNNPKIVDLMKQLDINSVYTADEHKQGRDGYYGYASIKHNTLGNFYMSFCVSNGKVEPKGYPWEFLTKGSDANSSEVANFITDNAKSLSKIVSYVDNHGGIEI